MNIHEYQAKEILRSFGVPTPRGMLATSAEQAVAAASKLGGSVWVVKAQIHAGGRGKAGGVRVCKSADEVKAAASDLLGSVLVTKQTGEAGKEVRKVYIEEGLDIASEFYLSLLVDREAEAVAFVVSPAGGMDIEEVAAKTPEQILTRPIAVNAGLTDTDCAAMAEMLELSGKAAADFRGLAEGLYRVFTERDCSLLELNPLVRTASGDLVALDAKMSFDDNALYRQPEASSMRDAGEEDARETEAAQFGLNYIALDGSIGCMVNGAGLAMATMDIIQLKGEKPANFLDVGGGVTVEAVTEAFKLLFSDAHVKAV
ncbi:MAG: ADP-forming succinate--CoA ligase subunit beta, partial [Mariprofundaceae bacterium]|nr:ADP-forming succinate--CoA ligase subunit beta [Mariprofundaceae bacterium]